jgi:Zn-dependent protease with chaperone function
MPDSGARRFEQLSPKSYEHPADRAATAALRQIPLMDKVLKRLTDVALERQLRQLLIGNAVRVGERQIPRLWADYRDAAEVLDLEVIPDLYVTQTPLANALTIGSHTPVVVVYSGLVNTYEHDETAAVLAHELGHVLSEHYYYTTAYVLLAQLLLTSVPGGLSGLPIMAIYLVLMEWARAAELSSDRASALVLGDPQVTCRMLMRPSRAWTSMRSSPRRPSTTKRRTSSRGGAARASSSSRPIPSRCAA